MTSRQTTSASTAMHFDWQGHRGCRGLMPENTVPAFLEALKYPVTTLELDIVISKDNQVVVSHEPWMNPTICTAPDDAPLNEKNARDHSIYAMTLAEIQSYDCGSKGNPQFSRQQKMAVSKPTLSQVVTAVRVYCKEHHRPMPGFNIEIKSTAAWYDSFVPRPEVFVARALKELKDLKIEKLTTLQSFDIAVLREIRKQAGDRIPLSYLIEKNISIENAVGELGFVPEVYSPYFFLINADLIAYARSHKIRVIPWTVNTPEAIQNLRDLGVDGIITDYPDLIPVGR